MRRPMKWTALPWLFAYIMGRKVPSAAGAFTSALPGTILHLTFVCNKPYHPSKDRHLSRERLAPSWWKLFASSYSFLIPRVPCPCSLPTSKMSGGTVAINSHSPHTAYARALKTFRGTHCDRKHCFVRLHAHAHVFSNSRECFEFKNTNLFHVVLYLLHLLLRFVSHLLCLVFMYFIFSCRCCIWFLFFVRGGRPERESPWPASSSIGPKSAVLCME